MGSSWQGGIEVSRHSPRIMRMDWNGEMSEEEWERLVAEIEDMLAGLGEGAQLRMLVVVGSEAKIQPKVRSSLIEFGRRRVLAGTAIVHAPRRVRVMIQLIANAVRLLLPESDNEIRFFEDAAEGLAWLEPT